MVKNNKLKSAILYNNTKNQIARLWKGRNIYMDERDFELLLTLDKTQNITHASDVLFVTQSSLSKRIAAIEKELDISLLVRSKQGIRFTPQGEIVLSHVKEVVDTLSHMRSTLDSEKDYVCGTLNAGVSINYSRYRLPAILASYRKQYPHVNTHITTDQSKNLYLRVLDGKLDVAIIRGEYPWKGNKLLLERENICAIALEPFTINDLSNNKIPFIGRKTDTAFERELAQWMHEQNIRPDNQGIFVDNIETCVEMVNRKLGWTIVPEICLGSFNGFILPLTFANGEPFVRSTYIMYADNYKQLSQVEAFINIVKENSMP